MSWISQGSAMRLRHNTLRRCRSLFLLALTLVPLLAGGHFHSPTQHRGSDSCATCMVKQQAGATVVAPPPVIPGLECSTSMVLPFDSVPAFVFQPQPIGRGPPALFATGTL